MCIKDEFQDVMENRHKLLWWMYVSDFKKTHTNDGSQEPDP
jgi:hypothetical protein